MLRRFHFLSTILYATLIALVYGTEISTKWGYQNFPPAEDLFYTAVAIFLTAILSLTLPAKNDSRGAIILIAHYTYFVPSIIFSAATGFSGPHLLLVLMAYVLILCLSGIVVPPIKIMRLPKYTFLLVLILLLSATVFLVVLFGGLSRFNLDFSSVYEFRRESAESLPGFFAYFVFGAAKVVAPMVILLSIHLKNRLFFLLSTLLLILLFSVTHHKSIIILPMLSLIFYWFMKTINNIKIVSFLFLGAAFLAAGEIALLALSDNSSPGIFNSYLLRRGLFLPVLLDHLYLDFFLDQSKYYWSTSRFNFGISENPYGVTAPFLIGGQYFGNAETSANSGVIGGGFSQAGFLGVALYAALSGFLLALLQAYGRSVGHAFVFAASLPVFISILTSTDFATALFTHGLVLLIFLLALSPSVGTDLKRKSRNLYAYPLHYRPSTH